MEVLLGIDVGGSGIKGGLVDTQKGEMISDRIKYKTPKKSTPEAVIKIIGKIIDDFEWKGKPFGVGFPSIIKHGVCYSASNIHKSWIGYNLLHELTNRFSSDVVLMNDADVAGIAEMEYGQGLDVKDGIIILLTLGTGIGSAIFHNGILLPNTELGQLHFKGGVTERYAANSVREEKELSWSDWGKRVNEVIKHFNFIFSPDLFIIGGGVSKKYGKYSKHLSLSEKIVPAQMLNNAGIVGAALAIHQKHVAEEAKRLMNDVIVTDNL